MDTVASFFLQSLLVGVATFGLTLTPVQAQQGSDVSGAVPQSDVSGALTQGHPSLLETDALRSRMSSAADVLVQAMREGTLDAGEGERFSVPSGVAALLTDSDSWEAGHVQQQFVQLLTDEGVPEPRAQDLAQAASGLLTGSDVAPNQFQRVLQAFNAAVDAAPASFLNQPPQEFVVVRAVLTTLLRAVSA